MPKNPVTDVWQFLTATTSDYLRLGSWRYLILALFWTFLVASIAIALQNWKEDPEQRTGKHLGTWLVRVLIGCMWFEAMLWKLPLPASEGLQYWTEQEVTRAAFEFHRTFVKDFLLPYLSLFGPLRLLGRTDFCHVDDFRPCCTRRRASLLSCSSCSSGSEFICPGDPAEWPWSYIFLAMLMFLFSLYAAGRSLGLDAWLRRRVPAVRDGGTFWGRILRVGG